MLVANNSGSASLNFVGMYDDPGSSVYGQALYVIHDYAGGVDFFYKHSE